MTPQKINDIEAYKALNDRFSSKETLSNNYMLYPEVSALIDEGRLSSCNDEANCFFLVKKEEGVTRLYYLLNDLSKALHIDTEDALVTEILFRGNQGEPSTEIEFLEKNSFVRNIRRDQFSGLIPSDPAAEIIYAKSEEDALSCINLFNSTFDKYSGDFISPVKANRLYEEKSLLCAYDSSGNIQGSLETTISGRNAWVAHLVVDSAYRGKGVANKLMDMFVTYAMSHECKRLMLWVNHENNKAVSLYRKYGLNYANKSTISLIKI